MTAVHSFGTLPAALVAEALNEAVNFEGFLGQAMIVFKAARIPWNAPDSGGQVGGTTTRIINRTR